MREKNLSTTLAQEHDEQLQDLLKKYKAQVQQSTVDSIILQNQIEQIADLERDKKRLQEQLNEAVNLLDFNKLHSVEKHKMEIVERKLKDAEAKIDLEIAQKLRYEVKNFNIKKKKFN